MTNEHPFVATPNNGLCSSCGKKRNHRIHKTKNIYYVKRYKKK